MELIKLEFLKKILLGCVSNKIVYDFFNFGYPDIDTMNIEISKEIPSDKVDSNNDFKNSYTMIGWNRLCNIHSSLDYIRENNIEGDVMETGVWKGGACIFMAEYIKLYKMNKNIYVADSFDGLPRPNIPGYEMCYQDIDLYNQFDNSFKLGHLDDAGTSNIFDISIENVKSNFKLFGLLDDNVVFIKGWFKDTMVSSKDFINNLSLLRLDGDLYSSTMDVLDNMYYKVSNKGVVIIDDYGLPRCKEAVVNFRDKNNISDVIIYIDTCGVYWHKNN